MLLLTFYYYYHHYHYYYYYYYYYRPNIATLHNFTCYRGRKQVTTKFAFSFCIWIKVLNNLIPGEFAYIWQSK